MRSRLRLFALVGVVATVVDFGLLIVLDRWWDYVLAANAVALAVAAAVAYGLNRKLTFRGDPNARWVSNPSLFAGTALTAGAVDMVVLWVAAPLIALAVAKLVAIALAASVRWFMYRWILFTQVRRDLANRVERPVPQGTHRLSVVIPAYNEETRISETVAAVGDSVAEVIDRADLEIVVVDDGSSDNTAQVAEASGASVVRLPANAGKGAAVRQGVLQADGRTIVFTDADLAYPPQLLVEVMAEVEQGWDMVVGSRRHDQTNTLVRARRLREIGGRLVNRLTYLVLLGQFRDTQCGIKGFQADVARTIFERTRIDGFAFDVELFLIAEQDQLSLKEIPVSVENRAGSSVRLIADSVKLLADLLRIRRWAGKGVYQPNEQQRKRLEARR